MQIPASISINYVLVGLVSGSGIYISPNTPCMHASRTRYTHAYTHPAPCTLPCTHVEDQTLKNTAAEAGRTKLNLFIF